MTHAVVWIDHKEARIFHVLPDAADESTILSPQHHIHRHPKGRGEPREHPDDAQHFFDEVARALDGEADLRNGLARPAPKAEPQRCGSTR